MAIKRARAYDNSRDDDFDFDDSIIEDDESFEFITAVNIEKNDTKQITSAQSLSSDKDIKLESRANNKKTVKRNRSITLSELGSTYDSSRIVKHDSTKKQIKKIKDQNIQKVNHDEDKGIGVDWVTKYTPQTINDISVHVRKIKEVKDKLKDMISSQTQCRVLILKGPCGTGKSTLVKLLAKELLPDSDVPLIEYFNPLSISEVSHVNCFKEFLKSARYRQGKRNNSIILIEDLPFLFHEPTKLSFQEEIYNWLFYDSNMALPPLVFCVNEFNYENHNESFSNQKNRNSYLDINSNYSIETIFGFKILKEYNKVISIKFNPVNKTLMKKTLQKIINSEKLRLNSNNSHAYLDTLVSSGDLRSSILSLQFLSLISNNKKGHLLLTIGKESQMDLFHLIGRLVFGTQKFKIEDLLMNIEEHHEGGDGYAEKIMADSTGEKTDEKVGVLNFNNSKFKEFNFMLSLNFKLSNDIIRENSYLVSKITFMNLFLIENYNIMIKNLTNNMDNANNNIWHNNFLQFLNNISIIDTLDNNEITFHLTVRNSRCYLNYNERYNNFYRLEYDKYSSNDLIEFLSPDNNSSNGKENHNYNTAGYSNRISFPRDFKYSTKKFQVEKIINFQRLNSINSTNFEDIALYQGYYEAFINNQKLFKLECLKYANTSNNNDVVKDLKNWSENTKNILIKRPGDGKFDCNGNMVTQNEVYDDDNNSNRSNNRNNLFELENYYKNYSKNVIADQFNYSSDEFSEDIEDDGDDEDEDEFEEILSDSDLDNFI